MGKAYEQIDEALGEFIRGQQMFFVATGYGVPRFSFEGYRPQLPAWVSRKGTQGLLEYQPNKNRFSIDDLPALRRAETDTSKRDPAR